MVVRAEQDHGFRDLDEADHLAGDGSGVHVAGMGCNDGEGLAASFLLGREHVLHGPGQGLGVSRVKTVGYGWISLHGVTSGRKMAQLRLTLQVVPSGPSFSSMPLASSSSRISSPRAQFFSARQE